MPLCKYHKLIEESVDKRDWVAYWLEFGTSGMLILASSKKKVIQKQLLGVQFQNFKRQNFI